MIPLSHGLFVAGILFLIGFIGVILRKNYFLVLLGLEIMINAAALSFVISSSYWEQCDGQIMYIFIITIAAIDASISLGLLLQLQRYSSTLNIDIMKEMRR